ncbi:membrane protein [Streptomyces inusitatus]|uniref:Membrane protein n=1 Tax=Streptomyces inusitatus TaxID=68221 RepID=A0A918V0U6_9ACTN|nr:glycosyltransferase 87 family protein [Streptomyces inusitatus]GGZ51702.1 membrane protein [Streptomyces inusitatus]
MTPLRFASLQPAPLAIEYGTGNRPRHALTLAAVWAATRVGMLVLLLVDHLGDSGVAGEVHRLYRSWYEQLVQGAFPLNDVTWQYPPGAAVVFLSPAALPWLTYFQAFVAVVLLADAVVTLALARAGLRGSGLQGAGLQEAGLQGAWLWICGLPLLLNLPLARYDVPVTAFAVLALLALRGRPHLSGALAGIGALLKVWPLLTLLGTPKGRTTRTVWACAAASAAVLMTVLMTGFSDPLDFLRQQGARGVQIESLGGTALLLAGEWGWPGKVAFQYGAFEFTGPYVPAVARLSLALSLGAMCWLLLWRIRARRWTPATAYDAAFAAVLLFTVTSRVLSPQYLIWLLGLAAVCLTSRHTCQRQVALLMIPAAALSSLAFPLLYDHVVEGTALGCLLMVLRNGLLVTAAVLACRRLWAATV